MIDCGVECGDVIKLRGNSNLYLVVEPHAQPSAGFGLVVFYVDELANVDRVGVLYNNFELSWILERLEYSFKLKDVLS